jgi:hypothetical protein
MRTARQNFREKINQIRPAHVLVEARKQVKISRE